ncbi:MAG: hypothetical protein KC466_17820, partial [Myxococcales bacterium]|nr:hypothetical protein [Myxococcales bacterium]
RRRTTRGTRRVEGRIGSRSTYLVSDFYYKDRHIAPWFGTAVEMIKLFVDDEASLQVGEEELERADTPGQFLTPV